MSLIDKIEDNRFNPIVGKELKLLRKDVTDDYIIGELSLFDNNKEVFNSYTIERPWKDNEPYVSAIPPRPGEREKYKVDTLENSPSFNYKHLWLRDVQGRTYIKVHIANKAEELNGCIAPGFDLGSGGVLRSSDAMDELMSYFKVGDTTTIEIAYL